MHTYFLHPRILTLLSQSMAFHPFVPESYLKYLNSATFDYAEDFFNPGTLEYLEIL